MCIQTSDPDHPHCLILRLLLFPYFLEPLQRKHRCKPGLAASLALIPGAVPSSAVRQIACLGEGKHRVKVLFDSFPSM